MRRLICLSLLFVSLVVLFHGHSHASHSKQATETCQLCQTNFVAVGAPKISFSFQPTYSRIKFLRHITITCSSIISSSSPRAPPRLFS